MPDTLPAPAADEPRLRRRALVAASLMGLASLGAQALIPTRRLADLRGPVRLEDTIPKQFGEWRMDPNARGAVVSNPQTDALLQRLYTEILERTYVNNRGERVMLSIAYGADQSHPSVQLHYPEVCYPAQGFKVEAQRLERLGMPLGSLNIKRLETNYAGQRPEPVTYWTMVGDLQSLDTWSRRLAEIRHGLRGEIVDGVLMRVSSIHPDAAQAFKLQDRFITAMVAAMDPVTRKRLTGL